MTDIKVGQIYETDMGFTVVSFINDEEISCIYDNGEVGEECIEFFSDYELITDKYKTWQEAVNSKEFNDE